METLHVGLTLTVSSISKSVFEHSTDTTVADFLKLTLNSPKIFLKTS